MRQIATEAATVAFAVAQAAAPDIAMSGVKRPFLVVELVLGIFFYQTLVSPNDLAPCNDQITSSPTTLNAPHIQLCCVCHVRKHGNLWVEIRRFLTARKQASFANFSQHVITAPPQDWKKNAYAKNTAQVRAMMETDKYKEGCMSES